MDEEASKNCIDMDTTSMEDDSTEIKSRLGNCEVCVIQEAKYSCPKCEVKTCSLPCNKIHKSELECDGQRDRTKFIPLNKFTNLDLSSDYRLLEEITRNVHASRKKYGRKWDQIPVRLLKLKTQAKLRKTQLMYLPYQFSRHKENTTFYSAPENKIYWRIDWIFVNAEDLKIPDPKIKESEILNKVFSKFLNLPDDEPISEKLQFYKSAGFSGVRFYLKAERKSGKKFYELDPSLTLEECLQRKFIIEYPTIHVVLSDHGCGYDLIDSEDEGHGNVKEEGNKDKNNFLFASEYSDDEDPDDC